MTPTYQVAAWLALIIAKRNNDGSLQLPGADELQRVMTDKLKEVLQASSGTLTIFEINAPPPVTTPPPVPAQHAFTDTNQDVINLFARTAGQDHYIDWLTRAGLLKPLTANRTAPYNGPAIEDLPLTDQEKARLIAALPPGAGPPPGDVP